MRRIGILSVSLAATLAFLLGSASPVQAVLFAPHGAGGTYNAYEYVSTSTTWDQARFNATGMTFQGTPGHLATIKDAAENGTVNFVAPGDAWIGLTDATAVSTLPDGFDPATTLSTAEFFNTSGLAYPPAGQTPASTAGTQRGEGWAWVAGEPLVYQNWGGGEPNDSGNEDAAQIRGDGMWNDHHAGTTIGDTDHNLASVVEFDAGLSGSSLPAWQVEDIRGTTTPPNNGNFVDLARNPDGTPTITTTLHDTINFGGGNDGEYRNNNGHPEMGFPQGGGDNFLLRATSYIKVPTDGTYTFNGAHDDSIYLEVGSLNGTLNFTDVTCCGSNPVPLYLTAGVYPIEMIFAEYGGGEHMELGVGAGTLGNGDPALALLGAGSHPAGLEINQNPDALGGLTIVPPAAPLGWNVVVQNASASPGFDAPLPGDNNGQVNSIVEGQMLLDVGGAPEATDTPLVINYGAFPAGTNGDDFALEARGFVDIMDSSGTADVYLYVNSDDGFRLEVNGTLISEFAGPTGNSNTLSGLVTLSDDDLLRLVFFERAGGEKVLLSRDFDGDIGTAGDRVLVGDIASGILIRQGSAPVIPEPTTLLIWSLLAGLGVGLGWRRRSK